MPQQLLAIEVGDGVFGGGFARHVYEATPTGSLNLHGRNLAKNLEQGAKVIFGCFGCKIVYGQSHRSPFRRSGVGEKKRGGIFMMKEYMGPPSTIKDNPALT
ncbi:MAG: hypothetical protein VCF24_23370 [Candidatus Latescibacterota bacterium]